MKIIKLATILSLAAFTGTHAATIVTYDFTSITVAPTTTLAGFTAGNIVGNSLGTLDPSSGNLRTVTSVDHDGIIATAWTSNDFHSFTITSPSTTNFETLQFNVREDHTNGSPKTWAARAEIPDGEGGTTFVSLGSGSAENGTKFITIDLTAPAFSALQNVSADVTFSFATATNNNTSRGLIWDDFVLEGAVVPEPSTSILVGLGLMGLCFRRRRNA
jgi:hypothetical protein